MDLNSAVERYDLAIVPESVGVHGLASFVASGWFFGSWGIGRRGSA